jgi:hypothetical protein
MDPRTSAAQPQATVVKRKLVVIPIPEVKQVSDIEVPADSSVFALSKSPPFGLVVLVPEGSGPIKRRLWITGVGSDISAEAQHGDYLGEAYLPSSEGGDKLVLVVAFIETQKQAIDRARHLGHRAVP